jgi:hypothetical protein
MLVAGGLLDQPIGWFALNKAGNVEALMDRMADEHFEASSLLPSEMTLYIEIADAMKAL